LARIQAAEARFGRPAGSVKLVAVSKGHPAELLRAAAAAGQRAFGESYLQEALPKIEDLSDLRLEWHFIGRLQSNKASEIAERFDWVHSVDRLKVAEALSRHRPQGVQELQLCLQVNVSGEASKGGVAPADLTELARAVQSLPGLRLRGLMAVPAPENDPARQREAFARVRALADGLRAAGIGVDSLSLGMSADLEAAIAEGATIVRVGTDIFGPRAAPVPA
jgi:pyridoxal phosphate enzyme (YggS family)